MKPVQIGWVFAQTDGFRILVLFRFVLQYLWFGLCMFIFYVVVKKRNRHTVLRGAPWIWKWSAAYDNSKPAISWQKERPDFVATHPPAIETWCPPCPFSTIDGTMSASRLGSRCTMFYLRIPALGISTLTWSRPAVPDKQISAMLGLSRRLIETYFRNFAFI